MKRYIKFAISPLTEEPEIVKYEVAQDENTSVSALLTLLSDKDSDLQWNALRTLGKKAYSNNLNNSDINDILSSQETYLIRYLAQNPNVPIDVLKTLAEYHTVNPDVDDTEGYIIRRFALQNLKKRAVI